MTVVAARLKGFTLVEVLVALTLTGLVMLLVSVGLNLGVRNWESLISIQETQNRQQSAQWMLRKLIGQARNEVLYNQGGESMIAFAGYPDEITFVAPLPGDTTLSHLYWIRIGLEYNEAGRQGLLLSYLAYDNQPSARQGTASEIESEDEDNQPFLIDTARDQLRESESRVFLLHRVSQIEIDYRHTPDDHLPSWETEWEKQKQLPELIRVRLADQEGRVTAELMIKPQVHNYEVKQLGL
ncbi:PulJ/GspJ family protein [Aliamphritea hakodatensis]|uniref:PulJ/GspJ family protein n=1 Tax=Aliamphritea hakodatensis TaxID=2895352 RepID=UPI0022FD90B8|nr:prepilin-type N-terminal cleavage/methylation domain-containing protein [Aliamphritea hakodatensis]